MSVHEDWWIDPRGHATMLVQEEHAAVALREMLLLPDDYPIQGKDLYGGLAVWPKSVVTAAKKKGADPVAVAYLQAGKDPRLYLIKEKGWIRIARNKVNVWKFNEKTLKLLRKSDYWKQQPQVTDYDMLDFDELSTRDQFSISVGKLRNPSAEAEALKRMATGVGQFRNPEQMAVVTVGEYTAQIPTHLPGDGTIEGNGIVTECHVDERGGIEYDSRIPPWVVAELAKRYV